eukprot:TRINITY_DN37009_c0_g1_i2.p1 TRINITY_DN37009_c0_g1~~TRINITY_DN37009_c0_g1_i2.p1  ORF type:complete len:491 (-),score=71.05 TRINITY_DN37009_c0_g1_i2:38-1510(-)
MARREDDDIHAPGGRVATFEIGSSRPGPLVRFHSERLATDWTRAGPLDVPDSLSTLRQRRRVSTMSKCYDKTSTHRSSVFRAFLTDFGSSLREGMEDDDMDGTWQVHEDLVAAMIGGKQHLQLRTVDEIVSEAGLLEATYSERRVQRFMAFIMWMTAISVNTFSTLKNVWYYGNQYWDLVKPSSVDESMCICTDQNNERLGHLLRLGLYFMELCIMSVAGMRALVGVSRVLWLQPDCVGKVQIDKWRRVYHGFEWADFASGCSLIKMLGQVKDRLVDDIREYQAYKQELEDEQQNQSERSRLRRRRLPAKWYLLGRLLLTVFIMALGGAALYVKTKNVADCFYTCLPLRCMEHYSEDALHDLAITAGNEIPDTCKIKKKVHLADNFRGNNVEICQHRRAWEWSSECWFVFLAFFNQVASVVRSSRVRKERIDRFVFAGPNSRYDCAEGLAKEVFHARIICEIFARFRLKAGLFFALTLSDVDLQRMLIPN